MKLLNFNWQKTLFLTILLIVSLGINQPVFASFLFYLTPMVSAFTPVGRNSSQTFRVVNTSEDQPVAVELYLVKREVSDDGNEIYNRENAEDNFLIYPPQTLLQPGEEQTVRVTWLGETELDHELSYRLIAEQVPIDFNSQSNITVEQNSINLITLVRYAGSIYIRPEEIYSKIIVESAKYQRGENGEDQLSLTLFNQGTSHTLLDNPTLTITSVADPNQTVTLTSAQLETIDHTNILAQTNRNFILPFPQNLPRGEVNVTFHYDETL